MPSFRLNALTRATRLWGASFSTALLLPFSPLLLADDGQANVGPVSQQEATVTGQFINLQALKTSSMLRSSVEAGTERLEQEMGLRIRSLVSQEGENYKDLTVMVGQLEGRARSLKLPGDVILAARPDGSFVALLPDADAIIRGDANGEQTLIRHNSGQSFHPHNIDYLVDETNPGPRVMELSDGQKRFQLDRNAQGEIVIDVLAGFSKAAVAFIGDHEAFALVQIASVNSALKQSRVEGVRVRLVGTQVVDKDYPITTETLGNVSTVYAEGIRQYSPDAITSFIVGDSDVDTAVGWAYVNGRYSINYIGSPSAFRHEFGHNVGGHHCNEGEAGYAFGYNNGHFGTIMCGNAIGYYSDPDVKDRRGVPVGDARTAHMTRVWRQNAARMSAYQPAVMPLQDEASSLVLDERVDLKARETRYFPLDVPEGTQRLVFSVVDGELTEDPGKVQLLLKHGSKPTNNSFDYRSVAGYVASLGVDNPKPGRWYLAMKTDHRPTRDQALQGRAYALTHDSVRARYLKLVATSSVDGKSDASIAELHLADAKGKLLPRDGWRVQAASSSTNGGHVIDGDWKTEWRSARNVPYPHEVVLDLGTESDFSQLNYLPSQRPLQNGSIKGYQVYGSNSLSDGWTSLAEGDFDDDKTVKGVALKSMGEVVKPPLVQITGKTEASAGDLVELDASASSDPQGHALSFVWKVSPQLDFDFDGARLRFTAPEINEDTPYRFTLTASNGKQSTSRSHEVLVRGKAGAAGCSPEWTPTTIYTKDDIAQWKGHEYQARWWIRGMEPGSASSTGPDGSGKVWRDLGPCQGSGETPTEPPVEEIKPPVAEISGATQAEGGDVVTLDAAGSSDPAGLELSYKWSVTPQVAFQASGATLTFAAPKLGKEVSYRFTLSLSNGTHSVVRTHDVRVAAEKTADNCPVAWSSKSIYTQGDQVSNKGRNYTARWWTKGNEPGNPAFTGVDGAGKVWRDEGACN